MQYLCIFVRFVQGKNCRTSNVVPGNYFGRNFPGGYSETNRWSIHPGLSAPAHASSWGQAYVRAGIVYIRLFPSRFREFLLHSPSYFWLWQTSSKVSHSFVWSTKRTLLQGIKSTTLQCLRCLAITFQWQTKNFFANSVSNGNLLIDTISSGGSSTVISSYLPPYLFHK